MNSRRLTCVMALTLFAAVPTALASTTWYVDGVHGSDNNNCKSPQTACKTIGHAISLASSGDTVKVASATYKENLIISFSLNLKLIGAGAATTIIDGGAKGRVIEIIASRVTLARLTIQNGFSEVGGGIYSYDNSELTISNTTITGNTANSRCTRDCTSYGGGIDNFGTLTIANSTISGNTASHSNGGCYLSQGTTCFGGGIFNGGTLMITNSTITGNYAGSFGGGIAHVNVTTINSSTLSGNYAPNGGDISNISNAGSVALRNSIVAYARGGNCYGTVTSKGYNLSSDKTCNFNNTGDLNNTDPKLGQLGNYGGPTQTIPLLAGSPAIDAGNPSGCTDGNGHLLKTDQRGYPRPDKEDKSGCDMGAYEQQTD